jgi:hypothetical protein
VTLPATLPAAAVPYLPSKQKPLTASLLAREAQVPSLYQSLREWGFAGAADRYFQGESRRLQVVDSRTLRFRAPWGASAFVAFIRTHVDPYLGSFANVRDFARGGRAGILAAAQPCQCHLSNPAFLAVVARGSEVTWLEINGPGATRRGLVTLMASAP